MKEKHIKILEKYGWEIECENPFEIRNKITNEFASGSIAKSILDNLKEKNINISEIDENLIDEAINDIIVISNLNDEKTAKMIIKNQYIIFNKQDL